LVTPCRSGVTYNFTDPENGMTSYNAARKTQLQIQGGLQYSTKPIYFKQKINYNHESYEFRKNIQLPQLLFRLHSLFIKLLQKKWQ
jgi:hypothetical protein